MIAGDRALQKAFGRDRLLRNEPLAQHTYIKVGGPADLFLVVRTSPELIRSVRIAREHQIPCFILGGGSNILVGDRGIRGLVIKNRTDGIAIRKATGKIQGRTLAALQAQVVAESGVVTNLLVRRTIEEGLEGLEYFLGIPGTLGGAIYNNSHYQKEFIGNWVETVRVLDRQGNERLYQKEELKFAYDYSLIQKTQETILSITFRLKGGEKEKLWKKAEVVAKRRTETQPLNFPSSGCIFKNPEVKGALYGQDEGKLSAGYLIDQAGLKGHKVGGAMVSPKHANFIINTGGATAKDILTLAEKIKQTIKRKFGLSLEMEAFPVGEF